MFRLLVLFAISLIIAACGKAGDAQLKKTTAKSATEAGAPAVSSSTGVGPVKSLTLAEVDPAMAQEGEAIFKTNCVACHKLDGKLVGPSLGDVTKRRKPEWIMNMILSPQEMLEKDPVAKKLLAEYIAPMTDMNLTEEQARKVLEFFRQHDSK
jgi:mono/diheme cytochrome c family protein